MQLDEKLAHQIDLEKKFQQNQQEILSTIKTNEEFQTIEKQIELECQELDRRLQNKKASAVNQVNHYHNPTNIQL